MNGLAIDQKKLSSTKKQVLDVINKKDITVTEWQIMYFVSHKARTGTEIADLSGIQKTSISRTKREMLELDMIKEGYAKGETVKKISLTPRGRKLVNLFKLRVKKAMGE